MSRDVDTGVALLGRIQCGAHLPTSTPLAPPPYIEYGELIQLLSAPGQTGLGKSTLINTIFASHLIDSKGRKEADEPVRQTTEIHPVSHGAYLLSCRAAQT